MNSLSNYNPNKNWQEALEANFSDKSLTKVEPKIRDYLQNRQLNYENFCTVLSTLLSIDDICTIQAYADLTQFNILVDKNKKKQHFIKFSANTMHNESLLTSHVDQIVLVPRTDVNESKLAKPLILANLTQNGYVHTIVRVTRKSVLFNSQANLLNQSFDVIFRAPRIPVRLMYNGLRILEKSPNIRRYLFPITDPNKKQALVSNKLNNFNLFNISIAQNPEQLQAVREIVSGPNPQAPYIVFGPPGTGKTTTIVEAIMQLHMKGCNRILVTAGSNSACDTISLRIIECIERITNLMPADKKKIMLRLVPYTRFKKIKKTINPTILKYANFAKKERSYVYEGLKKKQRSYYVYEGLRKIQLSQYGIVVATLCTVGIVNLLNKPKFTHIFIDEAAASIEPETILGMVGIMSNPCHVILSGDHKQLGAVIKNNRAVSLGLGRSLMERLLLNQLYEVDDSGNYDQTLQTRLRRNYRSHPEIVGIYNKLYYNGELIPVAPLSKVNQAANWSVLPNGKFPIIFQAAHGETEQENHSTSSFNKREADVLCWYLMSLLREKDVKQEDIGIVSPYLAQCKMLKNMLRRRGHTKVKVGSVESYQGGEKTIIIASMVSSFKSTNFLSNPRRVNVLLSRAKSLMILIGNPMTLSENRDFKFIIQQCSDHGTLLYNENNLRDDFSKRQEKEKYEESDSDSDSSSESLQNQFIKIQIGNPLY